MINKVTLIGNLGKDPEIRNMQTGDKVANLTVATTESWKDKNGERKEKTEWHNVVCFNQGTVKFIEGYAYKGAKVYVEGQLETRTWEQNGEKKYKTEIVIKPYRGEFLILSPRNAEQSQHDKAKSDGYVPDNSFDNEIPF